MSAWSMRWLVPSDSTSLPWWTTRSIIAAASLSSPRTVPHLPPPELDVGRDDETPPLAAVRHHLEQQPRAVELALGARPLELHHQARRRVEPHRAIHRDGPYAHRRREVGLAPPGPAVEHEAPGGVQEGGRLEVGRPAAVREGHPRAAVALERLGWGNLALRMRRCCCSLRSDANGHRKLSAVVGKN